jgi:hypothetical protein
MHVCIDDARGRLTAKCCPFLKRARAHSAGDGISVEGVTDNGSAYRSHRLAASLRRPWTGPHPHQAPHAEQPTARPSASSRSVCASEPMRGLRLLAAAPGGPRRLAGPFQHRAGRTALANQPPTASLGQTQFLGSTRGTVPRPDLARPMTVAPDRRKDPRRRLPPRRSHPSKVQCSTS